MIGNNPGIGGVLSYSKDATVTTNYADNYIKLGKGFTIESVFTVPAGATVDFVFDTSAITRDKLVTYPTLWSSSDGPIIITLGVATSYSGGTAITPGNREDEFAVSYPAQTVFKYGVTSTGFTASPTKILVGTSSTPLFPGGGSVGGTLTRWLGIGPKYVFRAVNYSSDAAYLYGKIDFFEF